MSGAPGPERAALRAAAERLERVTAELEDPAVPPTRVPELAREAVELSGRIAELLPGAIREAEAASGGGEGRPPQRA